MTFLQGLGGKQYAGQKGLYTAYIISAAKRAKNPVERAAYCSMLSSLDSVDFYTVSYTYTEQCRVNLYKSSSCVSITPTQNRVPQGVGVRFPPRHHLKLRRCSQQFVRDRSRHFAPGICVLHAAIPPIALCLSPGKRLESAHLSPISNTF
jgi:hypothetical protein